MRLRIVSTAALILPARDLRNASRRHVDLSDTGGERLDQPRFPAAPRMPLVGPETPTGPHHGYRRVEGWRRFSP